MAYMAIEIVDLPIENDDMYLVGGDWNMAGL